MKLFLSRIWKRTKEIHNVFRKLDGIKKVVKPDFRDRYLVTIIQINCHLT